MPKGTFVSGFLFSLIHSGEHPGNTMTDDAMMQEALQAIRNGQRARARDLLTRLLRSEEPTAELWLYLSAVVETEKERQYCLESALKLEPQNEAARLGLVMLGAAVPDETRTPVKPQRQREWEIASAGGSTGAGDGENPRTRMPVARLGLLLFLGLGALGLIGYSIIAPRWAASEAGLVPTSTPRPLFASSQTATPESDEIPLPGLASTAVVDGPTPLASLLRATYTPTPRYVDTPHPADESFRTALNNIARGDYDNALMFFEQFLQNNPDAPDALYYRGQIYLAQGNYRAAREEFTRVIGLDTGFGPAYIGRAQADLGLNPLTDVKPDLDRGLERNPDFAEGYLARAAYWLIKNNGQAALEDAETALELRPESALAFHYLARAYLALDEPALALEAAQTANQLDFTLLENYLTLGMAEVENNDPNAAIGPLQTYLHFHPEETAAWLQLGRAQQDAGYADNALRIYDHVLLLDRTQYRVYFYRGLAHRALGDYTSALRDLRAAAQTYRSDFDIQMEYGITLHQAGFSGDGYLVIHALAPAEKTDRQAATFYYWRATTLQKLGELAAATRDWNLLLELPETSVPSAWAATAREQLRILTGTVTATPTTLGERTPTPAIQETGTPEASPTP